MPRKVDHNERRAAIANVVEKLVFERGIEALTIRDVAKELGYSTTIVSHYFSSKLEMLLFTHQTSRSRAEKTLREAIDEETDLLECLEVLLPISKERWRDWHTWFAFWGMAPEDPSVSDEWRTGTSEANMLFARLVQRAQAKGQISMDVDARAAATEIQIYINGIASLVAQDRKSWPADRQKDLLRHLLSARLLAAAPPACPVSG
ncbi:MAG: TetR family transcriptional regulator C-terminal domain-containing protein [Sphingomonadaceae bacterium]